MIELLLVEDHPEMARAVSRTLARGGIDCVVANSCSQALEVPGYFCCAVLDIDLGDGNGIELAETLIELGRIGAVVFHSGNCEPLREARARTLGELVAKSLGSTERVLSAVEVALSGADGALTAPPQSGVQEAREGRAHADAEQARQPPRVLRR